MMKGVRCRWIGRVVEVQMGRLVVAFFVGVRMKRSMPPDMTSVM